MSALGIALIAAAFIALAFSHEWNIKKLIKERRAGFELAYKNHCANIKIEKLEGTIRTMEYVAGEKQAMIEELEREVKK